MTFIRNLIFATAIALFTGFASAHYAIDLLGKGDNLTTGQWTRLESIENTAGNPYRAALKVRTSGVALAPGEGLVFTTDRDLEGERFDAACIYRIVGKMPRATLWSLTVDGIGDATATPFTDRHFLVAPSVVWQADGQMTVTLSPDRRPGNWIATPSTGPFQVSLRLYDTPLALNTAELDPSALPLVIRDQCL
ncbi:MAG: DUF1214 domain-containing protein [Pseudomonadota bacterium]